MIVMKDPTVAQRMGMISAKAQIVGGSADWPTYLGLLAQAAAIGGFMVFSIIASWVFGREHSDRTFKGYLLAALCRHRVRLSCWQSLRYVPCGDPAGAACLWAGPGGGCAGRAAAGGAGGDDTGQPDHHGGSTADHAADYACGVFLQAWARLPGANGDRHFLCACWHRWWPRRDGASVSWAIPALYAGMAGPEDAALGMISYAIVVGMAVIGVVGTLWWWEKADHGE